MDDALAAPLARALQVMRIGRLLRGRRARAAALRVDVVSAVITGYGTEVGTIAPDAA